MVYSFLRPSEWTLLQNRHVRTFNDDGIEQLVLSVPNSKTKNAREARQYHQEVAADLWHSKISPVTMLQMTICSSMKSRTGPMSETDYPRCQGSGPKAGLERDAYGRAHTTYSLRHSSLCFQILKTGGNDPSG